MMYEGENVQPGETADMKPVAALSPASLDKVNELETYWSQIPHTWIEYELDGPHLINGRVYEISK